MKYICKEILNSSNTCFVCSFESLNLKFYRYQSIENNEQLIVSFVNIKNTYTSYTNIVHGGIVSTILDEAHSKLAKLISKTSIGVTIELNTNYLLPTFSNANYLLVSKMTFKNEKIYKSEAFLLLENKVIAKSNAVFRIFNVNNHTFKENHNIEIVNNNTEKMPLIEINL